MKRSLCLVLGTLVLVLAACGPSQSNPTAGPVIQNLDSVSMMFGTAARIKTEKNCFAANEPIIIDMTLQAGSSDLDLTHVQFFLQGPSGTSTQETAAWDSLPTTRSLIPSGESVSAQWIVQFRKEGWYSLYLDSYGTRLASNFGFGVGYLTNPFTDRLVPCSELQE